MDKVLIWTFVGGCCLFFLFVGLIGSGVVYYINNIPIDENCDNDMTGYNCTKLLECDHYCDLLNNSFECNQNYYKLVEQKC